jgi:hypothetical protein
MGTPLSNAAAAIPDWGPLLTLEIRRGRTRFPQRPVSGPRFFVGSGESCDLRLGGDGIPALHSLIQINAQQVWVEALAAEPPLLLNGAPTRGEWLRDGDRLTIGQFELLAHLIPVGSLFQEEPARSPLLSVGDLTAELAAIGDEPADVGNLSASDLVERFEHEQALVDEFESNQRAGIEAMLQTIRARQAALAQSEHAPHEPDAAPRRKFRLDAAHASEPPHAPFRPTAESQADAEFLLELERLSEELHDFSRELERRSMRVSQREASYVAAAETLLEAQRHLMAQLEMVVQRVAELQGRDVQPSPPTRAIA